MNSKRSLGLLVGLTLLTAASIAAATDLRAGYIQVDATRDRPSLSWDNPGGSWNLNNVFCVYRDPSLTGPTVRLGSFTSYPPDSMQDSAYETADYTDLQSTGVLQYWGFKGACRNNADGVGLTATTNRASAVPLAHYSDVASDGTLANFTLHNAIAYTAVYAFAIPQQTGAACPTAPVATFTGDAAGQGAHGVTFALAALDTGLNYKARTIGVIGPVNASTLDACGVLPSATLADRVSSPWEDPASCGVNHDQPPCFSRQVPQAAPAPTDVHAVLATVPAVVTLSWHNAEPYAAVRVYRNGTALTPDLDGAATSFTFHNQPFGEAVHYGVQGIPSLPRLPSEVIDAADTPVTLPAAPRITQMSASSVGFSVTVEAPAGVYDGPNVIQTDTLRWIDTATNQEYRTTHAPSALLPTAVYNQLAVPGTYRVFARFSANGVESGEAQSDGTVTILPQPGPELTVIHTPVTDAAGRTNPNDYYRLRISLAPTQIPLFSRVEVRDGISGWQMAELNDANGFTAENVAFCNPGYFRLTAVGYLRSNGAATLPNERTRQIPAMPSDLWTWISGESTSNPGHRAMLRVRANLPACSNYLSRTLIIRDRLYRDSGNVDTFREVPLLLGQDIATVAIDYPRDHSKDGGHEYQTQIRFGEVGGPQDTSIANWATMSLGGRPMDMNDDDRVDFNDFVQAIITSYMGFNFFGPRHDPNAMNFDRDRFIYDSHYPLMSLFLDCGGAPDYHPDGINEHSQEWVFSPLGWDYWFYPVFFGRIPPREPPLGYFAPPVPTNANSTNACIRMYVHNESEGAYNQFGIPTTHGPNQAGYPTQVERLGAQNAYHNH